MRGIRTAEGGRRRFGLSIALAAHVKSTGARCDLQWQGAASGIIFVLQRDWVGDGGSSVHKITLTCHSCFRRHPPHRNRR